MRYAVTYAAESGRCRVRLDVDAANPENAVRLADMLFPDLLTGRSRSARRVAAGFPPQRWERKEVECLT